jgi:UDP-glucose 4-epimerase
MSHLTTVLVTGGAGFIGTHTCLDLLDHGYEVVVIDDYSNSSPLALDRVQKLAGRPPTTYECDLRDRAALSAIFDRHAIDAVVHFAAKKAVGESVQMPVDYYDINVGGTLGLLQVMAAHDVRQIVFSSSCSIYGAATDLPITEQTPAAPTNPYARTKWMCEQILTDACSQNPDLTVIALRYFNPVGAHPSGQLGEDPAGIPNNVMPYLMQVAVGRLSALPVFGSDYPTADGTGVRDYIHVVDVADGHRVALEHLGDRTGMRVFNLGTGVGTSVLDLVAAFGAACGAPVPYVIKDRRPGDVPTLVADASQVTAAWGWRAERDLAEICRNAWTFQQRNPVGYVS